MMNFYAVVGIGLVAAVFVTVLKPMRGEYAALLVIAAGAIMLLWVIESIGPILDLLRKITMNLQVSSGYLDVVLKALGIAFITRLGVDCCKDAGQGAIGANIELCGRIAILITIIPLFAEVVEIINSGLSI